MATIAAFGSLAAVIIQIRYRREDRRREKSELLREANRIFSIGEPQDERRSLAPLLETDFFPIQVELIEGVGTRKSLHDVLPVTEPQVSGYRVHLAAQELPIEEEIDPAAIPYLLLWDDIEDSFSSNQRAVIHNTDINNTPANAKFVLVLDLFTKQPHVALNWAREIVRLIDNKFLTSVRSMQVGYTRDIPKGE